MNLAPLNPDALKAAARWTKPVFDDPLARPAASPAERRRLEAQQEGHAAGYAEGYARGLSDGRASGEKQGLAAASAEVQRLRDLLAALARPMQVVDAELERLLCAVTLEAARRIAQQELALAPERVLAVVHDAIAALGGRAEGEVTVYLHPDDHAVLSRMLATPASGEVTGWKLLADREVLPGGCRVDSGAASVMSSLDARAAGLAQALLDTP
jgi:flagellar assembly protein FliH